VELEQQKIIKIKINRSETYRGEAPFSKPETQNVKHIFDEFKNIKYYIDIHSFGEMILYSWGDDNNQRP
jgi:carboxypeptidase T